MVDELTLAKCGKCGFVYGKDSKGHYRLEIGCTECKYKRGVVYGKDWKPIGVINNEP